MEFLIEFAMFLAKVVTLVVAIVVVIATIGSAGKNRNRDLRKGVLRVTRLNDHYEELRNCVRKVALDKSLFKKERKEEKRKQKQEAKQNARALKQQNQNENDDQTQEEEQERSLVGVPSSKKRVYVLSFRGDIAAKAVTCLREEISAVLTIARPEDEVLLRLESPGGMVHAYGLAAAQLARIKEHRIPLTVCVDKVAASGGYMMACVADRLVAAPFAVIGSIGVVFQMPNFNRALKNHDVDYEIITAGQYKRTLTAFGEITEEGRSKVKDDVNEIHDLFKKLVKDHRPSVDIEKIATGEIWYGTQAKDRYMVDEIKTSDEWLMDACETADVLEVEFEQKKKLPEKLGIMAQSAIDRAVAAWMERSNPNNFMQ